MIDLSNAPFIENPMKSGQEGVNNPFGQYSDMDGEYSNFDFGIITGLLGGAVEGISAVGQQWLANRGASGAAEIQAHCGRRPLKADKRRAYDACVKEFVDRKAQQEIIPYLTAKEVAQLELQQKQIDLEQAKLEASKEQKVLGMKPIVGATVIAVGTLLIIGGSFFAYHKFIKK